MVKIKEGGFNIVRLAHYPQDPAVLDACDELGLLVIDCIPGWQFFNSDSLFVKRTFRDIRDIFRIPKFTWHFFCSQLDPGRKLAKGLMTPEVFITGYWAPGKKMRKVVVYGNVEEVELKVNGKTVARQKPDDGSDTPYFYTGRGEKPWEGGHPFDGGNCRQLIHPPFTFKNVKWEKGKITALGYIREEKVARHTVHTPGPPAKLQIVPDLSGRRPVRGRKDVLFVYVKLIDENGTLCVEDNHTSVTLKTTGAEILSPEKVQAEAGIATFLVSTYKEPEIFLRAVTNKGLKHKEIFVLERR